VVTACRTGPVGIRLRMTGGALTKSEEAAAAPGTQIEVEDLFFNTPARKKFLKTTTTEFSHICQVVQQAALAWPGTRFRLTHNGQEVADYPAVSSRRDRVLQVYGLRFVEQAAAVSGERAGVRVEGLAIQPMHTRAGRNPQELFVNRRSVKNPAVAHAVYDAYGAYLAKGQHPQFVLFVDVDSERVDVNVHPTKREVRFADQDLVFQAVRSAVRSAIGADTGAAEIPRDFGRSAFPAGSPFQTAGRSGAFGSADTGWTPALYDQRTATLAGAPVAGEQVSSFLSAADREIVPLGQLGRIYLVAQVGSELQVIDQHTAHERVLFERLCRARLAQALPSQPLLIPETVDVPAQHAALLQRHLPDLEQAGLTIEPFGAHTFVIRAVPALLKPLDYGALLLDLVDDLAQWNTTSPLETRLRSVMASLACHGAVRAGRAMELPEIKRLIEEWVEEGLPSTCPHGRRVALRLPEEELARIFGR
jgi:DNA mismatch repair protein MutL